MWLNVPITNSVKVSVMFINFKPECYNSPDDYKGIVTKFYENVKYRSNQVSIQII
jgi:hypothetical protein